MTRPLVMLRKVVILDDYQDVARGFADWDGLGVKVEAITEHIGDRSALADRLRGADVVVAMRERTAFDAATLEATWEVSPPTPWLGVTVCATGYVSEPTSEHAWALILAAQRNLPVEFADVRNGGWQRTVGTGLAGKTLGLLGLGRLGSRMARIGLAFEMDVIAWSQNLTADRAAEHGVRAVSKSELFEQSDVLSIHLVLSRRTRGLVGAAELESMKPSALLVNTSRGPIVDEEALLAVLLAHRIAGAALDVFTVEPAPADHPFRSLDNVVMTPHLGYVTREQYRIFFADAVADIRAYAAGQPVRLLT